MKILILSLLFSSQFALAKVVTVGDFISGDEPISLENMQSLIDQGANINAQDYFGETLLHRAVLDGYTDSVNLLIESGANINVQDKRGVTPFHWAVYIGDKDSVNLLISKGVDVNATDNFSQTPFSSNFIHKIASAIGTLIGYKGRKPGERPIWDSTTSSSDNNYAPLSPWRVQKDRQKREIGLNFKIEIKDKSSQEDQSSCKNTFK